MNRRQILFMVIGSLLATSVAVSFWIMIDARSDAAQAADDLQSCRQTAVRIDQLRRGLAAGPAQLDQTDIQRRSQDALQAVGLSPDHLLEIIPDKPQTLGQSAYKEVPTEIVLREMNLRQIVGFFLAVEADHSLLQLRSLRLSSPRDSETGAVWSVEATVSYLNYEPAPHPAQTVERD